MHWTEVANLAHSITYTTLDLRCRRLSPPGDIAFDALAGLLYYLQTRTIVTYAQIAKYADIVDVFDLAEGQKVFVHIAG